MAHSTLPAVDLHLLSQALNASVNGAVIADAQQPDLPIIYVNPAFEQLSGYPASEIIGRNCRLLQGQDPNPVPRAAIRAAIREGRSTTTLLRNYRPDGTLFYNELTISPIRDAAGTVTHFFGFQMDVTVREKTSALMIRLQAVTAQLAAVRSEQAAIDIILGEVLDTIGAVGGTVLLVQDTDLLVAARRGHSDASLWQDGRLGDATPAADVLHSGQPLFFRDSGQLAAAYPTLEAHTGGVAAVASAVFPMEESGFPLGVLVLDFHEPHEFAPDESFFLLTLASQCALALSRIRLAAIVEQQVKDRTAELQAQRELLQASNEALEAFTYSVSHDLRTPVRHIISFGDLLRRSLPESLDEKSERYFGIVKAAANHLETMIDGMLNVSRASRQPLKAEPVKLGRVFQAVHQKVKVAQPQRQIDWQISDLPTVMGDTELLRRVITALVDNAVKYTRARDRALIKVWAEDRGQSWAVLVRDNGVGFNPQYGDKLFTMFQRLHRLEEYEGAAVSLANARRIMTRHGGTMLAEGQPGVGATFGFTLPKVLIAEP
ncbi:ATP-binding protein [Deinococcus humi]|uniref:histidine kinase n=1 Tax=Deinococcus humi TaxID=662880 RepID=A0A7W8JYM9_9DEIO|nr:ATP-binding protein [Deinococcus humi]MBB5365213.1 PAS domain S-box-containing protein [Deinococcus humi]GGO35631.1 hypothetical protein GCM10008949_38400 [Deinococcus humi]